MKLQDYINLVSEEISREEIEEELRREEQARQMKEMLKDAWRPLGQAIKEKFPIDGIQVFAEDRSEFQCLPRAGMNYAVFIALPGSPYPKNRDDRSGVVIAFFHYDGSKFEYLNCTVPIFEEGRAYQTFDDPRRAVLAAYNVINRCTIDKPMV